ncbi:MAG: PilZ domain-containing protein [Bradyrhizobiaceae bacterium]|nr:MAG: PilZ domain-containing protein [Bradyrhizobiaceae bacterium]
MSVFKRETRKTRHKTTNGAWMTLDGGFAKRDCTVVDLSTTGACIEVKDAGAVPGVINVAFTKDVRKLTRCRLIWRKGSMIGVEFLAA